MLDKCLLCHEDPTSHPQSMFCLLSSESQDETPGSTSAIGAEYLGFLRGRRSADKIDQVALRGLTKVVQ